MKNILVSIISDHLIPNYQLYLHKEDEIDEHILLVTPKMDKRGIADNFTMVLGYDKDISVVDIDNFTDFELIKENLTQQIHPSDEVNYIVNLTGGSKMISMAVYDFFRDKKANMYYIGIGDDSCQQIYPVQKEQEKFDISISLENYLKLYGLNIEYTNELIKSNRETKALFKRVMQADGNAASIREIREVFNLKTDKLTPEQTYLKGQWFEEYTYQLLKKTLNIPDSQIAFNVKIKRNSMDRTIDNEYDVMYLKDNNLYVVECKSSLGKKSERKPKLENVLYKLFAVTKDMGLRVTPILSALVPLQQEAWLAKRCDILGIKLIGIEKFEDKMMLNGFVKLM